MNRTICRLAFRESGMYVVPVMIVLFGYVLLKLDPLRFFDTPVTILAVLLGFFLAWRTFADYGGVRAFLFSRSFTPTRFFLVRWLFGLGTLFAVGTVFLLLLLLGIRQGVQQLLFANGWFPMIRFEELRVLPCYALAALLSYHTTMYFMLTNRFRGPLRLRGLSLWLRRAATLLLILLGGIVVVILLFVAVIDLFTERGYPMMIAPPLYLIFGVPALMQLALAPWFGMYCYNLQEIES